MLYTSVVGVIKSNYDYITGERH